MAEWRDEVAWRNHSPEFLRLVQSHRGWEPQPFMTLRVPANTDALNEWIALPRHPNIIEAVAWTSQRITARYAAIAWGRSSSYVQRTVANWGIQLVDVFELILRDVRPEMRAWFLCPSVKVDIGGHVRVAFVAQPHDEAGFAPEVRKPLWSVREAALVYAVGRLLRGLSDVADPSLETIILRASEDSLRRRIKTLDELRKALQPMASNAPIRAGDDLRAWRLFETGVGWLELMWPSAALEAFEQALRCDSAFGLAAEGADIARWLIAGAAQQDEPASRPRPKISYLVYDPPSKVDGDLAWKEVEPVAYRLEQERAFSKALALYRNVDDPGPPAFTARARCHLYVGETGEAIDYATRAIHGDPTIALAHDILTTTLLQRRAFGDALTAADRFVADHRASARAHYLRGRALFANGRVDDARDAFETATKLDPKLLEAQLLGREVERVTGNVRQTVGKQHAPTFEIPQQLAELRDVLISGDTNASIAALRDDRFARDADAQLLLARFLAFDNRLDEAIAVYDLLEATGHRSAALVGKATALLDLGRTGDALSIFEQLPDDADAAEGRARALEQLGRLDEAAEAYRRFIALASSGSDLRVRAAQLALENIAQRRR
jgi:tetratricopeptide (TPR) repeat protein